MLQAQTSDVKKAPKMHAQTLQAKGVNARLSGDVAMNLEPLLNVAQHDSSSTTDQSANADCVKP